MEPAVPSIYFNNLYIRISERAACAIPHTFHISDSFILQPSLAIDYISFPVQYLINSLKLWHLLLKLSLRLFPNKLLRRTPILPLHKWRISSNAILISQSLTVIYRLSNEQNLRRQLGIYNNLSMPVLRTRNSINQSSSANQRIPRRKVHNQLWNQFTLVWIRKGGPRRARVGAIDRYFSHLSLFFRC